MEQRDGQLNLFHEQNQRLQELNNELQELLQILPSTEKLLELLEKKDGEVQTLKEENRMLRMIFIIRICSYRREQIIISESLDI